MVVSAPFPSVEAADEALRGAGYLADEGLATAVQLSLAMRRPLLLEGEAGVGKTQLAKTLAQLLGRELIRLQCYEGIDAQQALYEWEYPRQLLALRASGGEGPEAVKELYGPEFLAERPLLRAVRRGAGAVLLIDELDRADDEFEAFTFELLAESAVTIPELGTVRATHPPVVVLTSNRTRDLHDALKRRCLYHWIENPGLDRTVEIVRRRVPGSAEPLALSAATAAARLRTLELEKPPGTAEVIDWVAALTLLGVGRLDEASAAATLGAVVKHREDAELVRREGLPWLVGARSGGSPP
jgi:MoxR-like ATPase